jgi:hypothetical protein
MRELFLKGCLRMKKQLVALCLALSTVQIGLAQSPTEWRPSVAEDNKAATWEDTANFMMSSLSAKSIVGRFNAISLPEQCRIKLTSEESSEGSTIITEYNFAKVDPLTVMVLSEKGSVKVLFSGRAYAAFGTRVRVDRGPLGGSTPKSGTDLIPLVPMPSYGDTTRPTGPCNPQEKNCSALEVSIANPEIIVFDDNDSARRFARALLHASLLCGGTKAVSPF